MLLGDIVDETNCDCSTELSEKVSPSLLLVSASSFWLLSVDELVENSPIKTFSNRKGIVFWS